jgi:hypothetical protein
MHGFRVRNDLRLLEEKDEPPEDQARGVARSVPGAELSDVGVDPLGQCRDLANTPGSGELAETEKPAAAHP